MLVCQGGEEFPESGLVVGQGFVVDLLPVLDEGGGVVFRFARAEADTQGETAQIKSQDGLPSLRISSPLRA